MKKKILGGIAVLAIAAIAAFNVNMNTQSSNLSDISLANVEALAQYEIGSGYLSLTLDCYNWQGVVIGSHTSCYSGGSSSCTSTSC